MALALAAFLGSLGPGSVLATLGLPRQGKSRALKAADAQRCFPRRVVFDPYAARDRLEHARGAPGQPWGGTWISPRDLAAHPSVLDRETRLVVVPGSPKREDLGRDFELVAGLAWHTGGLDIIAEEAGLYSRSAAETCNQLVTGGGHAGLRLVLVCQSWARLAADVRRNTSAVLAFRTADEADLAELRKRCGREFSERLATIPEGGAVALSWRLGGAVEEVKTR